MRRAGCLGVSGGERDLRAAFGPLLRRDLAARAFVGAASGGVLGCGVAGLTGWPGWIGVAASAGALIGAARRSPPSAMARRLDSACATADAVACAWDHRDEDTGMARAQRVRALSLVAQARPDVVVPRPSFAWWASAPLMLATWLTSQGTSAPTMVTTGPAEGTSSDGASGADPRASVAQSLPPVGEVSDEPPSGQGGPAPPTGALRVGASAPGQQPPDAGASGSEQAPGELPSMARAGVGQRAAELAGARAEVLERAPAVGPAAQGDPLALTVGVGSIQRTSPPERKPGDAPRALLPGDDAWAPPERAHSPRWRAVVARYFARAESSTFTQGDAGAERGE